MMTRGSAADRKIIRRKTVFLLILVAASAVGALFGVLQAKVHGVEFAAQLPALRIALLRTRLLAILLLKLFHSAGLSGATPILLSLSISIFLNNSLVALIIAAAPAVILKAKPFSDKHLAKIYYERGIWIFKPVGWTVYRVLASALPLYGLALQAYLIGGLVTSSRVTFPEASFLPIEVASIVFLCAVSISL